jgi:hypothetical protein
MPLTKHDQKSAYLQGATAMGGFVITAEQSSMAIDRYQQAKLAGKSVSFEQARAEIQSSGPSKQNR